MEFVLWLTRSSWCSQGSSPFIRGAILYGIVLIVIGLLVGPGGVSIFT